MGKQGSCVCLTEGNEEGAQAFSGWASIIGGRGLVASVMSDSLRPYGLYSPPGSCVHGISQASYTAVGCHFLIQGNLPNPGIEPASLVSPIWQADSLPLHHLGSPVL